MNIASAPIFRSKTHGIWELFKALVSSYIYRDRALPDFNFYVF